MVIVGVSRMTFLTRSRTSFRYGNNGRWQLLPREARGWRRRLPFWIQLERGVEQTGVALLLGSFLTKGSKPWFSIELRERNGTS